MEDDKDLTGDVWVMPSNSSGVCPYCRATLLTVQACLSAAYAARQCVEKHPSQTDIEKAVHVAFDEVECIRTQRQQALNDATNGKAPRMDIYHHGIVATAFGARLMGFDVSKCNADAYIGRKLIGFANAMSTHAST